MNRIQIYQQARKTRDPRFDGQFFVAVKSTGIFCRPICPAPSPKEENVEYYELAPLAMQAGFRPCLRCRPDSAPGSYAWKGTVTTLERGIKLLRAHPELNVEQICIKLGVSDRYLRSLFSQKLGIAPKKFRLFDQLLMAKNLLHNSTLSIEDIAQASGFSSARRLQDNLRTNLQLTPSQIRKNSKGKQTSNGPLMSFAGKTFPIVTLADKSCADKSYPDKNCADNGPEKIATLAIQLAFREPYNWPLLRDFLKVRAIPDIEIITESSYSKCFSFGESKGQFTATINPSKRCFDVELNLSDLNQFQGVVSQIRRILDLDCDPYTINTSLVSTGLPSAAINKGLRIPGVWCAFEAACRAILGQQISVKAAVNLVSQLAHELGEVYQQQLLFPTAKAIAQSDLLFLKIPDKRRQCLRDLAQFQLGNSNLQDLTKWLSIKGIGPWTVAYATMRGLSEPDIWLNSDLVIKKQILQHQLCADNAAPWRSYLTFQLWSMA